MSAGTDIDTPSADSQYFTGGALAGTIVLLALANFMAILDLTIANVAIPHIAGSLAVSPNEGTWVITSYAVAEAITVPLTGWLSARFGAVRLFVTAAALFGIFSMACGFAPSLNFLVVFRVLQGLSGGPLMPMSQTLLLRVTPPHRVQLALSLQSMTAILAPLAGPVIGGVITDSIGWPWAFYINVPLAAFCAFMVWRLLKSRETKTAKRPIDYVGLGMLALWIGALQIMLDNGQNDDWFGSQFIVALAIVAAIGFVAFLMWEVTDEHPVVDLSVFRNRTFSVMSVTMALTFGSFFSSVVLIPLWLQMNMGYTATMAGYAIAFQGALGIGVAPIAALLVTRVDPRMVMSTGIGILSCVMFWRVTYAQNMTFWQIAIPQIFVSIGMPLFFVPLFGLSVAAVPPSQTASAAGLINFIRTMGGAFATALVTTAWDRATTGQRVELVGVLHRPQTVLSALQGHGFSSAQALQTLESMVESQAVMVATNQVYFVLGLITACVAVGVWLSPKPSVSPAVETAAH